MATYIRNNRTSAFSATRRFPMSSSARCNASWSVQIPGRPTGLAACERTAGSKPRSLTAAIIAALPVATRLMVPTGTPRLA